MSAGRDDTIPLSAFDFDGHECHTDSDRTPVATVTVNGVHIPVINEGIRTEIRTDEAMGLTRYSEVYFAGEWGDVLYDYSDVVRALDPDANNVYDPVDINIRDEVTGGLETVHRGFVMGVGGGSHGDIEHRMTVGDPGQLLGGIPFDGAYESDSTIFDVVEDVLNQFRAAVVPHVFESVQFEANGELLDDSNDDDNDSGFISPLKVAALSVVASANVAENWLFDSDKTFHSHTDTAADALDWVEGHVDGIFYFAPVEDTDSAIKLVYDETYPESTFVAEHAEVGDTGFENAVTKSRTNGIEIYRNNALHEIRPVNMATVRGAVTDDGKAPVATAVHERLLKRSSVPQSVSEEDDGVDTIVGTEKRAKTLLEDQLEKSTLGRILAAPSPLVTPHSTILSQPACGNEVNRDTRPFAYEVVNVVHNIAAKDSDGNRVHQTELTVAPAVEQDDITIQQSEMVQVTEPDKSNWERAKSIANDVTDISFPVLP